MVNTIKFFNYNFLKIWALLLSITFILILSNFESKAQGWEYDFAGKSLAQLVEEGFIHEISILQ